MLKPQQLIDLDAYWMPFTANRQFKSRPRIVTKASGAYYEDAQGRRVFDGLSGLWCCGLGHCRSEITAAIQSRPLARIRSGVPVRPSQGVRARRQTARELTPDGLDYVFYTTSGSEAADSALKIARAYWRHKGKASKTKLLGREKAYHGANFGGTSVGGIGTNRELFGPGLEVDHLRHTQLERNAFTRGMPEHGAELADELLELIALHDASNIAALIVEPFAGSAGVIVPPGVTCSACGSCAPNTRSC